MSQLQKDAAAYNRITKKIEKGGYKKIVVNIPQPAPAKTQSTTETDTTEAELKAAFEAWLLA